MRSHMRRTTGKRSGSLIKLFSPVDLMVLLKVTERCDARKPSVFDLGF